MQFARSVLQYLGLMRKQIAPLAAAFTFPAAKDLPERGLHVGRLHNLLDDMTNSAHKYLFLFFNTGPSIPRARLLRTVSGLPNPTRHSIFQFSSPEKAAVTEACFLGTTVGTSPRCCTPIKNFFSIVVQTRTDVRVRIRGIVVRIRHRDTAIRVRVVVATINHTAYGKRHL